MIANIVSFPRERVVRTPAEAAAHRQDQFGANVARLVAILRRDPRFLAMIEAEGARTQGGAEERPS